MAMKLTGGVGVVEIQTAPAAKKHVSAEPGDGQAGENAQPRVELLGHDVARGIKGNGAKSKNSRGMRGGDDETEQQGMPRGAPRADQVGGDDRLAVAGFKRVQRSQPEGNEAGSDEEPETHAAGRDQLSERAARGCLLVGLEVQGQQGLQRSDVQLAVRRSALALKQQVPPLRYAPVGMTILGDAREPVPAEQRFVIPTGA